MFRNGLVSLDYRARRVRCCSGPRPYRPEMEPEAVLSAAFGFLVSICVWWIYFRHLERAVGRFRLVMSVWQVCSFFWQRQNRVLTPVMMLGLMSACSLLVVFIDEKIHLKFHLLKTFERRSKDRRQIRRIDILSCPAEERRTSSAARSTSFPHSGSTGKSVPTFLLQAVY